MNNKEHTVMFQKGKYKNNNILTVCFYLDNIYYGIITETTPNFLCQQIKSNYCRIL